MKKLKKKKIVILLALLLLCAIGGGVYYVLQDKEPEIVTYLTLHSNNKKYLIYTDNIEDGEGNVNLYTSEVIEKSDGSIELAGIDDDAVWTELQGIMDELAKGA